MPWGVRVGDGNGDEGEGWRGGGLRLPGLLYRPLWSVSRSEGY